MGYLARTLVLCAAASGCANARVAVDVDLYADDPDRLIAQPEHLRAAVSGAHAAVDAYEAQLKSVTQGLVDAYTAAVGSEDAEGLKEAHAAFLAEIKQEFDGARELGKKVDADVDAYLKAIASRDSEK
jgi:hypothetical protein